MSEFQEATLTNGRENALKLIIDVNSDREFLLTSTSIEDLLKIHINTINPFTGYGKGHYIITHVKQMSTTKDFDNFPEDVKKCQNKETVEECSHRKLMENTAKKCGCLPAIVNHVQNEIQV